MSPQELSKIFRDLNKWEDPQARLSLTVSDLAALETFLRQCGETALVAEIVAFYYEHRESFLLTEMRAKAMLN